MEGDSAGSLRKNWISEGDFSVISVLVEIEYTLISPVAAFLMAKAIVVVPKSMQITFWTGIMKEIKGMKIYCFF